MVLKAKSPVRLVIEAELLACAVGMRVTYNQMAQTAHCDEATARRFASRAVKWVEKNHRLVFKAIPTIGYERVQHYGALARSESHRRGSVRKINRAIDSLPAAVEGDAPPELKGIVADKVMTLATMRQFARQKKFKPEGRRLPSLPDYTKVLALNSK